MNNNISIEQKKAIAMAQARKRKAMATQSPVSGVNDGENLDTSIFRTALDQGMQGATFGFSDEVMDRIGALIASQMGAGSYGDLLKEARSGTKQRMDAQVEENPVTSILSNIAGGVGTGLVGASTKIGANIASRMATGGLPIRIAKGVGAGAASGAAYGAGTAEEGQRTEGAKQGAIVGGIAGGAIPAIGAAGSAIKKGSKTAFSGLQARSAEELDQAAAAIKAKGSALYKQSRDVGAVINKNKSANIVNRTRKAIESSGKLNARLHGDTLSILDDMDAARKSGQFSLEELDQFRQLFSDVVNKNTDAIKGMNPDALKASQAISAIDDAVSGLKGIDIIGGDTTAIQALKEGRKEWQRFRKFEVISNIIKQADGDPNKIKSGLTRFVNKPKNLRGFTTEEKQALKIAATNSKPEKVFKALGRFGIDAGNVFLPVVSGGLGALSGVATPASALVITGTGTRQLNKLLGKAKAEQVLKLIEGGNQNNITKIVPPKKLEKVINILSIPASSVSQEAVK